MIRCKSIIYLARHLHKEHLAYLTVSVRHERGSAKLCVPSSTFEGAQLRTRLHVAGNIILFTPIPGNTAHSLIACVSVIEKTNNSNGIDTIDLCRMENHIFESHLGK